MQITGKRIAAGFMAAAMGITLTAGIGAVSGDSAYAAEAKTYTVNAQVVDINSDGSITPDTMIRIAERDGNTCQVQVDGTQLTAIFRLEGSGINAVYNGTADQAGAAADSQITPAVSVDLTNPTETKLQYSLPVANLGNQTVSFRSAKRNSWYSHTLAMAPLDSSVSKLKAGKKQVKVTWKNQKTLLSGVQIQYANNKSMKNAKTVTVKSAKAASKTVKKLKSKKKYSFQVRAYYKKDGVKTYANWSKVKTVKVK